MTKISIAAACALGVSAALAQIVQRGEAVSDATQTVAQAGGASAGASLGTTLVAVGAAVAVVANAADNGSTAVTHH
jgi:hypothetical protein